MEQSAKITSPTGTSDSGIASKIRKFNLIKPEKSAKTSSKLARKNAITKKEKLVGKRKTAQKKHNIVKFNPNKNADEEETSGKQQEAEQ